MRKPICDTCGLEMRVERVGVPIIVMYLDPPEPYRILRGDQVKCPLCGKTALYGMPDKGTEHFEKDFDKEIERIRKYGNPVVVWEMVRHAEHARALRQ